MNFDKYIHLIKRNLILIIFIFLLLFLTISYTISTPQSEIRDLSNKITEETGLNMPMIFYNFESAVNIFRPKKDLLGGGLPIYDLRLSKDDIQHINSVAKKAVEQGYLDKDAPNTWRDITIRVKDESYDAKLKLQGDLPNHWSNPLKSFSIKTTNQSINNIGRFNLIIFEDDLFFPRILNIVLKDFGLFDVRDDFVTLADRGKPLGFYYLQEQLGPDFLEYNKCSSCEIIQTRDNMFRDHTQNGVTEDGLIIVKNPYSIGYLGEHVTPFDFETSDVDLEQSDLKIGKVLYAVDDLFQEVKEEDVNGLVNFFDIDQVTSFEAMRMLLGGGPAVDGDNLRLVYGATNSKFYPIAKEGRIEEIKLTKGGFEYDLNRRGESELTLFALLNRNDEIRQLKYKKVYNYITNKGQGLLDEIDKQVNYYLPYINSYNANKIGTKPMKEIMKNYSPIIKSNMKIIKEALEYSRAYVNMIQEDNKIVIELIPDSLSRLKIDSFKIDLEENTKYSGKIIMEYNDEDNNVLTRTINVNEANSIDITELTKEIYFSTGLDEEMFPQKRTYIIKINFPDTEKISVKIAYFKIKNDITNNYLKDEEIYLQILDGHDYYESLKKASLTEFIEKYPEFNWSYEGNNLILNQGEYILRRDMVIPESLIVTIEAGTKILIDDGKAIVSYSPVNIQGERNNPVIITALNKEKPFGTFGIVGDEKQESTINWLELSEGNEKWINGLYLSGGISIYHMDVYINNTKIFNNHADDGINVKYSKVIIDNSEFFNNYADQIDLDFTTGVVKNSQFKDDPNGDNNGDGLDLSGSEMIVKNNDFIEFKDKGISVGEKTKAVLYENKISDCNIGVAVKDLSNAYLINNFFKKNNIAISSYQKKPLFGGGISYSYKNIYESNVKIQETDEYSKNYDIMIANEEEIIIEIYEEDTGKLFQVLESINIEENGNKQ